MNKEPKRPDGLVEGWKVFHVAGEILESVVYSGHWFTENVWMYPAQGWGPFTYFDSLVNAKSFQKRGHLGCVIRHIDAVPWTGDQQVWDKFGGGFLLEGLPQGTRLAAAIMVLPEGIMAPLEPKPGVHDVEDIYNASRNLTRETLPGAITNFERCARSVLESIHERIAVLESFH